MKIHITNIYGVSGTGVRAQHAVADIAKRNLNCDELGIYVYPIDSDSPEMLRTRLDGILASVSSEDIVIVQAPTWNGIRFDEAFVTRLSNYRGLRKIIFIQDVPPLMFEGNRSLLKRYVDLYNLFDLVISPSQNMVDFLKTEGLNVDKIIIQRMWDFPIGVDTTIRPPFKKTINFAGNIENPNFSFVKGWKSDKVELAVTANKCAWGEGKKIRFLGWQDDERILARVLRNNGGFGLLWTEDRYTKDYMKLNACCKLGTYLGTGIPVIVHNSIPESETILQKNLGFVVNDLGEAVTEVERITEEKYIQMVRSVDSFGSLIREGYFAKKALIDSVFKLLYE